MNQKNAPPFFRMADLKPPGAPPSRQDVEEAHSPLSHRTGSSVVDFVAGFYHRSPKAARIIVMLFVAVLSIAGFVEQARKSY